MQTLSAVAESIKEHRDESQARDPMPSAMLSAIHDANGKRASNSGRVPVARDSSARTFSRAEFEIAIIFSLTALAPSWRRWCATS